MYCPACGADTGSAKFCPECGTDLRALATPPRCAVCGAEVPSSAKFCPECGEPSGAANARPAQGQPDESVGQPAPASGRPAPARAGDWRTGTRGKSAGSRQQRRQQSRAKQLAPGRGQAPARRPAGRVPPFVAWGALAAVAVVAILVVVFVVSGRGGSGTATSPAAGSPQPVVADTSGSYSELVQRANDLYDQGSAKLQVKQYAQGAQYFLAASKVYAAAWDKQATDPAVGTDYATSLFYAGKVDAAIEQVDKVVSQSPRFQTAWFNKGNYLAEKGSGLDKAGNAKAAKAAYASARTAYQKAISLGATTDSGQQAQQQLDQLPE
jgi:hypothetical protein